MAKNPYQLNIRIDAELKEEFFEYARKQDSTVTELIINYMKSCLGKPVPTLPSAPVSPVDESRLSEVEARWAAQFEELKNEIKKLAA